MRSAAEAAQRRRPDAGIAVAEIAGGIAAFAGKDSPITQTIGVGMNGPVSDPDLDELEQFFRSRGAAVALELCPLIDITIYQALANRGYTLAEVSSVLVRDLTEPAPSAVEAIPRGIVVRPIAPGEADLWRRTVAEGFAEFQRVTETLLDALSGMTDRPNAESFLAFIGGEVAGGAAVAEHERVGGLFGASTLPQFRRRGVQAALLGARLAWMRECDCDVAVSITQPASSSQRNIERFGFRVAYTRTKLVRA
jgi:GNAT superfamily N-acetyltransferase